jgi:hypothetical protein
MSSQVGPNTQDLNTGAVAGRQKSTFAVGRLVDNLWRTAQSIHHNSGLARLAKVWSHVPPGRIAALLRSTLQDRIAPPQQETPHAAGLGAQGHAPDPDKGAGTLI